MTGVDINSFAQWMPSTQAERPVRGARAGRDDSAERSSPLSATTDLEAAVKQTEITFVVVPTPSLPDGTFSLQYVVKAAERIAEALRQKSAYHLVVISSTVIPGSTDGTILPLLERISGKKCGQDFGLCYNPEFIALGSVIHDMSSPDMILIGESDPRAGELLEKLYRGVCSRISHPWHG